MTWYMLLPLIAPLVLLGVLVLLKRLAVSQGWIVRRRQPTEYELALEQLHVAMDEAVAAISKPLFPILEKLATELTAMFPPLSRRQRALFWITSRRVRR